ncbi:MAG: 2-C-methyl-D-erythritol 4-phosphate cytidylyltransferase [Clostridiales bacterium]|nr:2-C-methyl-D-erythritol 4-phosphate cytidylyltransferase [Clostridiales bacterium]
MISYAIVLGGGSGQRMGAEVNKVFLPLRGVPAIVRSIAPFSALCRGAVVVARAEEVEHMQTLIARYGLSRFVLAVVPGGGTRQASVKNGMDALPADAEAILVHDGARCLVTEEVIGRVLSGIVENGSAVAAVQVTDTIKRAQPDGRVLETLNRSELYAMQTPQGFLAAELFAAHEKAARENYLATDDAALVEYWGKPVFLTEGSRENLKLTTPVDLAFAEAILRHREEKEALQGC